MPEIKSTDKYGCHNRKPFKPSFKAQDGTRFEGFLNQGRTVHSQIFDTVKHRMSTDCQYDKAATDSRCAGCKHINESNADKYALKHEGGAMWNLLGISKELWEEFKLWRKSK
jgi:hypothetical protein